MYSLKKIYVYLSYGKIFAVVEKFENCHVPAHVPVEFLSIYEYFGFTYIKGPPGRNALSTPARYPPYVWNVYDLVLLHSARTNNISEAWHSRFQGVVAKHHPTTYVFLKEILKEQADTELMIDQLALGQRVKKVKDRKRRQKEARIFQIVNSFNTYLQQGNVMDYLRNIGHYVQFED